MSQIPNIDYNINDSDNDSDNDSVNDSKNDSKNDSNNEKYTKIVKNNKPTNVKNIFCPDSENLRMRFPNFDKNLLFATFGLPYIVCLKDSATFKSYFYDKIITKDQLNELITSIEIMPISYKVINNLAINYLTSITPELFSQFAVYNKYGIQIEPTNDVLVCCLFRFKYSNIIRYLKQFDGISNFMDLYTGILIGDYLGQPNKTSTITQNHISIISNMSESNYYTIYNNCQLNITLKFKSRRFKFNLNNNLADKSTRGVLEHLSTLKEDNDYLAFILKKKTAYVDASSGINLSGYKLYRISNSPLNKIFNNEHFNILYNRLSGCEKYHLIMNCLISKDLCHYVINNSYILDEIMSDAIIYNNLTFMDRYVHLIRYLLGYTWLILYIEESIKKSYITQTDRFIFDIDTACKLPFFPFSPTNIHNCPYLPILVDETIINAEQNILGVNFVQFDNNNIKKVRYGVCDKITFIERVNIFVSGHTNINLLKNINWSNIAMSGSIMAACLPNFNPLMSNFIANPHIIDGNINFNLVSYFREYYKEADIDMMCNLLNIYDFIDKIHEFKETIETNIKTSFGLTTSVNITNIFSNKTISIIINKNFIKKYLINKCNKDYNSIVMNLNEMDVKIIIYEHYVEWHKNYLKQAICDNPTKFINSKYCDIYDIVSIENINVILIESDKDKKKDTDTNNETDTKTNNGIDIDDINYEHDDNNINVNHYAEDVVDESNIIFNPKPNFKYRISSAYLPHCFEFFQIKSTEFFNTVSRFHLPIVRSYFTGENIFITPSCISACMTFLNIDYKYFTGAKDPIEIINKYRRRGFGTILNNKEIFDLISYSNSISKWKKLYNINIQSSSSVEKILGNLTVESNFFSCEQIQLEKKNRHANLLIKFLFDKNIGICDYINQTYKAYNINNTYNMSKVNSINENGYIAPVQKWLISAFYDLTFNKCT